MTPLLTQTQLLHRIREECGLAVGSRTVNAWVAAGMPFIRLQRRKVYAWDSVLAWLMAQRGEAVEPAVRDSLFRRNMRRAG